LRPLQENKIAQLSIEIGFHRACFLAISRGNLVAALS
jgi:hypothetical protein